MQKIIFSYYINNKNNEYNIYFKSEIRIIYLQILYLISMNINSIGFLSENFEDNIILDYYFNLLKHEKSDEIEDNLNINNLIITNNKINNDDIFFVSDYEFVLICSIINQLFTVDSSHIPIILADYLDDFIFLSKKREKIKKYIQLLFDTIEIDSQYGDSLIKSNKKKEFKFGNDKEKIKISKIWRLECDKKDKMHFFNYEDFIKKNNKEEMKDYVFPIIFDDSINYFKYDEYNDDIFDLEIKNIIDYEKKKNNKIFITIKDLIDQCQSI